MANARTIDEVILALTGIIRICEIEKSRLGYFPALYRRVTAQVKAGIASGRFEDGARMERLDVVFANRYLEAWDAWRNRRTVSGCWRLAFEAGGRWRPVILQHLLAGMNAHINLDLAVAAAETCPGREIQNLKADFDRINQVLGALTNPVELELAEVSPWIGLVKTFGGHSEDAVLNFDMQAARDLAWQRALRLADLQGSQEEMALALAIKGMDWISTGLGKVVLHPGPLLRAGLLLVRARESSDAVKVMAALTEPGGNG